MPIGDVIRRRRTELGLTQRALAARVGVNPSAVAHWELGGGVAPDRWRDIARALGADLPGLLARERQAARLVEDPDELAVLAAWRGVPTELRPLLLRMVLALDGPAVAPPRREEDHGPPA